MTMSRVAAGSPSGRARYARVTLAALIAAIAQVALGGIVRVTGSGDACPDWPLCHGQIIPPLDYHIWLEFTHRLAATVVGVLVVISLLLAWRHLRTSKPAVAATGASLILVVAAAILGGLTVLSELSWWVRLIHLALAELTVATLAIAWLVGRPDDRSGQRGNLDTRVGKRDRTIAFAGTGGLLIVILYGSYMVGLNYGTSCPGWPLCTGLSIPDGVAFAVNMGHRYMVAVVAVLVFRACFVAWNRGSALPQLRWLAALTSGLLLVEIGVGALTAWLASSPLTASLHLTFATLSWVSMVVMVAVLLDPATFRVPTRYRATAG